MTVRRVAFLLPIALVALVAAGCGGGGGSKVAKGDVAVVDGTPISRVALDEQMALAEQSYKSNGQKFPKAGSDAYISLQQSAVEVLVQGVEFEQKAKELGVAVTGADIEKRLKQIKAQFFGGSEKQYRAGIKKQGLTDEQVRERILRPQILQEKLFAKVTEKVKVSDADVKEYYTQHPELYSQPQSRDVRHILVKDKALADKIYAQLKGGADFAKLAKQYSTDPGSKDQGGKLTISKGETVPEFDRVAFALKTDELSRPVKTQYGWHVIQALGPVKPRKTTPFAQVKASIRQQLEQQKKSDAANAWSASLKKEFEDTVSYAPGFAPPPPVDTTGGATPNSPIPQPSN